MNFRGRSASFSPFCSSFPSPLLSEARGTSASLSTQWTYEQIKNSLESFSFSISSLNGCPSLWSTWRTCGLSTHSSNGKKSDKTKRVNWPKVKTLTTVNHPHLSKILTSNSAIEWPKKRNSDCSLQMCPVCKATAALISRVNVDNQLSNQLHFCLHTKRYHRPYSKIAISPRIQAVFKSIWISWIVRRMIRLTPRIVSKAS